MLVVAFGHLTRLKGKGRKIISKIYRSDSKFDKVI